MLYQPMDSALRPYAHRMIHEVGNISLLSLVHHVVMLVNMEYVRWRDVVCLPPLPPSGESMIMTIYNYRHRAVCPVEQFLKMTRGILDLVKVIEVDIKDGVHLPYLQPRDKALPTGKRVAFLDCLELLIITPR